MRHLWFRPVTFIVLLCFGSTLQLAAQLSLKPTIVTQPISQSVAVGGSVTFSIAAVSASSLKYQWKKDGVELSGKTSATLTLEAVTSADVGDYVCEVSNEAGVVTSAVAKLTLNGQILLPQITVQPQSQSVNAGANVSLKCEATGSGNLKFQWKKNGVALSGKTSATLDLNGVTSADIGDYVCEVSNEAGVVTSAVAKLVLNGSISLPGDIDLSFAPKDIYGIKALAVQADGKVVIGGEFDFANGVPRKRIARLNADGTLDIGFNVGLGADGDVLGLALQGDGKIVICGAFSSVNGIPRKGVARLNADGNVDLGFNIGNGCNGPATSLLLQGDGKIVIAGEFSQVDNLIKKQVARLDVDGRVDASFDVDLEADGRVLGLKLQNDGKLVLCGTFKNVKGAGINGVARLNLDGSVDLNFKPDIDGPCNALALSADGKIVVGGSFSLVNGKPQRNITKLNLDGTLDLSFKAGGTDGEVLAVAADGEGAILIAGEFPLVDGKPSKSVAQLKADGSLDLEFQAGLQNLGPIRSLSLSGNGTALAGGEIDLVLLSGIGVIGTGIDLGINLSGLSLKESKFHLPISTVKGKSYAIEFKNSLNAETWTRLPAITGDGNTKVLVDSDATVKVRFYRLHVE